jgi:hypothetical protein
MLVVSLKILRGGEHLVFLVTWILICEWLKNKALYPKIYIFTDLKSVCPTTKQLNTVKTDSIKLTNDSFQKNV